MKRYGPLAAIAAVLPLLAFESAARPAAPTQWALVIGVSDYVHCEDVEGGDLPGAEHDARAIRDVLVARWGFAPENVRLLLNGEATRAAIENEITGWLGGSVQPGDNVVVYFAGHGSQVWDENGDEEDGLDETIAPADVSPTSPELDITDDVLGEWLRALPTENVVYVHDNCNAGTGTRAVTPFSRARKLARDPSTLPNAQGRRALPGAAEDQSGFDIDEGDVLELAAAQPDQAAVDAFFQGVEGAESFYGGAFTTYLVQQLWKAPATSTYEDVFLAVRESLKSHRFQQDPHISDDVPLRATVLFAGAGGSGRGFIPVLRVRDGVAELGAGQVLGLTAGSVLDTDEGARLVVESVSRDRTTTRVLRGTPSSGARARLVGYRQPETVLRVNVAGVDSEAAEGVRQALSGTPRVLLIQEENGYADLFLRRRGTEVRIYGLDGFPRKGFQAGATAAADIAAALNGEAAAKRLAEMDNMGQRFDVRVWIEGNRGGFGLGELVKFQASSEREGYLTVVDLGTDDKVTVLFPNAFHRDNRIGANTTFTFPSEAMGFDIEAQEPAGRGMVRAFLTPTPLDLPIDPEGFVTGDVLLADRVAEAVRRAAGTVDGSEVATRLDNWGTASLVYDITR